jgi:hypothetical protein
MNLDLCQTAFDTDPGPRGVSPDELSFCQYPCLRTRNMLTLLPFCFSYPAARLAGLQESLDMNDSQFQTGLSILFVGYVLMQVPSNMLLNYCGRPSLYLGFWTVVWGLVSALTSLVNSYGEILACRFILGFVRISMGEGVPRTTWLPRGVSRRLS